LALDISYLFSSFGSGILLGCY